MAAYSKVFMEEPGSILIVAGKDEAFNFVKSALAQYYKKISRACNFTEAKQKLGNERVVMMFVFTSTTDGCSIDEIMDYSVKKTMPSILVVQAEVYGQCVYKARNNKIFLLTHPIKKNMVIQAVNIMYESYLSLEKAHRENEKLKEKFFDLKSINTAKLLLIEKRNMTEDEAHHAVEKLAMDKGITKRKAADLITEELNV